MLAIAVLLCLATVLPVQALAAEEDDDEVLCECALVSSQLNMSAGGSEEILLGDLVADAVLDAAGADVALVAFGDLDADHRLQYGTVTRQDVLDMFAEDREIAVVELDVDGLVALLEHSVSHITLDMETETIDHEASAFDGFLSVAGISVTYDVSAPVGERVLHLYGSDGEEIDLDQETTFLVAASSYMLEGGYGFPEVDGAVLTGVTMAEATVDYISTRFDVLDQYDTGRISLVGSADDTLISYVPIWGIVLLVIAILVAKYFFDPRRRFDMD